MLRVCPERMEIQITLSTEESLNASPDFLQGAQIS